MMQKGHTPLSCSKGQHKAQTYKHLVDKYNATTNTAMVWATNICDDHLLAMTLYYAEPARCKGL